MVPRAGRGVPQRVRLQHRQLQAIERRGGRPLRTRRAQTGRDGILARHSLTQRAYTGPRGAPHAPGSHAKGRVQRHGTHEGIR